MEIEWLEPLETRVREAVDRLGDLKEENRTLRERVGDLEGRLAGGSEGSDEQVEALQARVRDLEEQLAEAAEAAEGWEAEREEVRRRVEGLVERLEGLSG